MRVPAGRVLFRGARASEQPSTSLSRVVRAALQALALLVSADAATAGTLVVHVRDVEGGAIAGAEGRVTTGALATVATAVTNEVGTFTLEGVPAGRYVLTVQAAGFAVASLPIDIAPSGQQSVTVTLDVAALSEDVTVTAEAGRAEMAGRSPQAVNVISQAAITQRTRTVVAQAVAEEAGVHLQRTSPTMAGIFVRGLTGNKVNVFVDGVRYTTGAQRGGVNTFHDLIEPTGLDKIEILRGPNSAQYGSDALGGSVQFQSIPPSLSPDGRPRVSGTLGLSAGTAERFGAGNVLVGYSRSRFAATVNLAGRGAGDVRPGEGVDSHAAVTRFFGVASDRLMSDRLPDTSFSQWGTSARANWSPAPSSQFVVHYLGTRQDRGRRYDQLLGGDGNLIADLRDLTLDFFYARYERIGAGWFDDASVAYSINSQREERVNQGGNGNPRATITFEPERTTVNGVNGRLSKALWSPLTLQLGGDAYFEGVDAPSTGLNPVTGVSTVRRGRVPDEASYAHGGAYVQTFYEAVPNRVRLHGSVRVSTASYRARAADSPLVDGAPLWPDDRLRSTNAGFRTGIVVLPDDRWNVAFNLSRGFRAPHITDLGTLGLTGSGYEVAAPDVAGLGGSVGATASRTAASTGNPVEQVGAETSLSADLVVRYRARSIRAEFSYFNNTIHDNIQKQALILPQGSVGVLLGGQPVVEQLSNGVVFVPLSSNPVLVRANFDNARVQGVEGTAEWKPRRMLTIGGVYTYMRARDLATGAPPNIEGGTPAPDGYLMVRYVAPGSRWWVEPYLHGAWRQEHLSTLDLEDRRTGATRSRTSIRSFFLNGATVRGWVAQGADASLGSPDDVLEITGETVAQIQDRVLGADVTSAPLYTSVPAYVTVGIRAGLRAGRHEFLVDAENLGDENYRGISWGVDAPGRGVSVKYLLRLP